MDNNENNDNDDYSAPSSNGSDGDDLSQESSGSSGSCSSSSYTDSEQVNDIPELTPEQIISLRDKYIKRERRLNIVEKNNEKRVKVAVKRRDRIAKKLYCWDISVDNCGTYILFSSRVEAEKWVKKLTDAGVSPVKLRKTKSGAVEYPECIDDKDNEKDLQSFIDEATKKANNKKNNVN